MQLAVFIFVQQHIAVEFFNLFIHSLNLLLHLSPENENSENK